MPSPLGLESFSSGHTEPGCPWPGTQTRELVNLGAFDLTSDQLEAPNWTWRGKGFCWEITLPYSKFLMDLTDQLN